jgi:hypothetical protein
VIDAMSNPNEIIAALSVSAAERLHTLLTLALNSTHSCSSKVGFSSAILIAREVRLVESRTLDVLLALRTTTLDTPTRATRSAVRAFNSAPAPSLPCETFAAFVHSAGRVANRIAREARTAIGHIACSCSTVG